MKPSSDSPPTTQTSIQKSARLIAQQLDHRSSVPNAKYDMRFYEFHTNKPRKPNQPRKPLTPEQSLVAAKKRQVDVAKQALQSVKDHQKQRKEQEQLRNAT